jgi:hypothetical protein
MESKEEKEERKQKLRELRKIEKQAKLLIYKMRRLESDWKKVREELTSEKLQLPNTLGDIISNWNKLDR